MNGGMTVYWITRFCENWVVTAAIEVAVVTLVSQATGGGSGVHH